MNGDVTLRIQRVHDDGSVGGRLNGHRFTLTRAKGPAALYQQTSGTTTETSVVVANGEIRSCV